MKRVFLVLSFLVLFTFLCVTNVSASECTLKELRELKALAKKVQVTYEFDEESKLFDLNAYNLSKKFYITFSDSLYVFADKQKNIGLYDPGFELSANIYSSSKTNCEDELLTKIKIVLPNYNTYSTRKECIGKETLNVCKKWSNTNSIDEKNFLQIIKENNNESNNFFQNIIFFIKNNAIYFVVSILIIGVVIAIFNKYKKNKKNRLNGI